MSEIVVGVLGILGIILTYVLKRPERKKESLDTTVSNLRADLTEAKNDAKTARTRSNEVTQRLESLEDRERRRFVYELKHREWDMEVLAMVRRIEPSFPPPPPFSYFEVPSLHEARELLPKDENETDQR